MAPQYKLVYFQNRGGAELARILFKYGNIEFEDIRIAKEDWPELKPKTPFGVLPVLKFDGQVIGESMAIGRYVANLVGLAGNNPLENLKIDSFVDTLNDFRIKFTNAYREQDEEKKKELFKQLKEEQIPFYFSRFEKIIEKNNGYAALDRLTWADVLVIVVIPGILLLLGDNHALDAYPNTLALVKKVESIPKIKEWLDTRPPY